MIMDGCRRRTNLLTCGGCGAVLYCSAEHQRADWPRHKTSCKLVKECRTAYRKEEAELRANENNYFENSVGYFWLVKETRPYMQARFNLITSFLNIRTGEAVQAALTHALDMLRLNRSDNRGVHAQIPALYLRLGRDQEAYDFVMWYTLEGTGPNFRDMSLPFLDLHGADALESADDAWARLSTPSLLVALTLIKVRLMMDVRMLRDAVKKSQGKTVSVEEKLALLREDALSDVLLSRPDILAQDDYEAMAADLLQQVQKLYGLVKSRNKHFWPAVLNPGPYANAAPCAYTFGSKEEVNLIFRESWYALAETEAAINFIRDMIAKDQ